MKVIIPPPTTPARDYRLGGNSGSPITVEHQNLSPLDFSVTAWFLGIFSPNGTDTEVSIYVPGSGNPVLSIEDSDTSVVQICEGNTLSSLRYLRCRARRTPGSSGPITAQTIRLLGRPQIACTADAATDVITAAAHGLVNKQVVQLAASVFPTGLAAATDYIVRDVTLNTFKLTATLGGSAINFTTNGTALKVIPGAVEIARLQVKAAAAGAEPEGDWIERVCVAGEARWSCTSPFPLTVNFEVSDVDLQISVEAAGLL